jgi:tetratricopeptide (TPR) repeat protein
MTTLSTVPLEALSLYRQALEMSVSGNHESAINYLSRAVKIAPQFTTAICEMGYCYEKIGRFPEALMKFDKVLQIDPSHGEAEANKIRVQKKIWRAE